VNNLKDKKIGILGLGNENIALVKYLVRTGSKSITICDKESRDKLKPYLDQLAKYKLDYRLGPDYLDNLRDFNIVFRTPGLPYRNEKILKAKENSVEISSAIKLFFELSPSPIIGITGTKGKGTTSTLIAEILKCNVKAQSSNVKGKIYLGGNIGVSPIEFIEKLTPNDIVVLELSSFQLQDMDRSPHIAVVLDIKSDHLDYHKNQDEYVSSKQNIVNFQHNDDYTIINADYLTSFEFATKTAGEVYWISRRKSIDQGAFVLNNNIYLRIDGKDHKLVKTSEVSLRGEHNLENICAAATAAYLAGADIESIKKVVKNFVGLEHRLEYIAKIDGIKFYNDSFSTTPDTTIAAIKSFNEPIILIAGGSDKLADYTELGKAINHSTVKVAILIGKTGPRIEKAIGKNSKIKIIDNCKNLKDVIRAVEGEMCSGDIVLLSPASASFDWFSSYKERGEKFKIEIFKLENIQ
jgi:UDP-N-acetylmuramoylalanine--D-glutamate ligase